MVSRWWWRLFWGSLASGIKMLDFIFIGYSPVLVMLFSIFNTFLWVSSGVYFRSSTYTPSFPKLLLFFSFGAAFTTSSLSKGSILAGLVVGSVSSEENNFLKNYVNKFTCTSSDPTIFPSLSLMISDFFHCVKYRNFT